MSFFLIGTGIALAQDAGTKQSAKEARQAAKEARQKAKEAEKAAEILKQEMENAVKLSVPLTVEVHSGKNWYDAK